MSCRQSGPITIRDLLSHTAGISYGTGRARRRGRMPASMAGISRTRPCRSPRSSRDGEAADGGAAGRAVRLWLQHRHSRRGGREAVGPVARRVPERAADRSARNDGHGVLPAAEKAERLAVVYSAKDGRPSARPRRAACRARDISARAHYLSGPCKAFAGGAGLLSTARDYSRFLEMLLTRRRPSMASATCRARASS